MVAPSLGDVGAGYYQHARVKCQQSSHNCHNNDDHLARCVGSGNLHLLSVQRNFGDVHS